MIWVLEVFLFIIYTKSPEGTGLFVFIGKQLGGGGKRCLPGESNN